MKIWKLVLLVFCLFFLFGCVESGKENQKVTVEKETSKEKKQETEEKKEEEPKKEEIEQKAKISREDALYSLIEEYEYKEGVFKNSTVNTFQFADIDNDGENEVIFYTTAYEYGQYTCYNEYDFFICDNTDEKGFHLIYQTKLADSAAFLYEAPLQEFTFPEIYGFIDNDTKQLHYYLAESRQWIEMTTMGSQFTVYEITAEGLKGLVCHRYFSKYPQENVRMAYDENGELVTVDRDGYLNAIDRGVIGSEIQLSQYTSIKEAETDNPVDRKKNLKEMDERAKEIVLNYDFENTIYYSESEWREEIYEDDVLRRGNYIGNCIFPLDSTFVENDLWIFYTQKEKLIRIAENMELFADKEVILEEYVSNLNIAGEYLYFITNGEEIIYRCRFDGTDRKRLGKGRNLQIYDDYLYYTTRGENPAVMKMRLDGSEQTVVCPMYASALSAVVEDKIYFLSPAEGDESSETQIWPLGRVYRVNTDGTNLTQMTHKSVANLIYSNQSFYYLCPDEPYIYQTNMEFSDTFHIVESEKPIRCFNINDREIVFFTNYGLYNAFCSGNGKDLKVKIIINNVQISDIFVTKSWIYYRAYDWEEGEYLLYRANFDGFIEFVDKPN